MRVGPVFIGNFRSGTTLLVNLLGGHPEISAWFETKGLCELLRWQRVLKTPETASREAELSRPAEVVGFGLEAVKERVRRDIIETRARIEGRLASGKGAHERYPLGHDRLLYTDQEALEGLEAWSLAVAESPSVEGLAKANGDLIRRLGALQALRERKPLWVNKTPEMTRFGFELEAALGPVRRIVMIRDGREVVRSAARLQWASAETLAAWWKGMILESRAAGRTDDRHYLEVRYEDLLREPARTLDRVFDFLEVERLGERLIRAYPQSLVLEPLRPDPVDSPVLKVPDGLDREFLRSLGYSD